MEIKSLLERYNIKNRIFNSFDRGIIPHAMLIDGLADEDDNIRVGIAKAIALYLVCNNMERPCFNCFACKKILNDNHPDVIKMGDNSGSNSFHIDKIRQLRQDAFIIANESNYKIYILDYADNMTVAAQNALLKILEEPPKDVVFILICKSSFKLLQTIRSRCQIFSFESEENKMYDRKVEGIVKDIINGVVGTTEWDLMISLSKLVKDKLLLRSILNLLIDIYSKAIRNSINQDKQSWIFAESVELLSFRLTRLSLVKSLEILDKTNFMLEQNVNMNLLISFLGLKLRESSLL